MFHSPTGLPHLLRPADYYDSDVANREKSHVLEGAWHLVGTVDQIANDGDFFTLELLGYPIQIRRFKEGIVALSNVCAHRHCLISSLPKGNSQAMACQYHGWEYGEDGYTRKIPCAKDLAPIDRSQFRLSKFSIESCGQLLFVRIAEQGRSLREHLGPLYDKLANGTGVNRRIFLRWSPEYSANWKVAIENSLEAYHVESVHPNTFRSAPGENRSEHILEDRHTAFGSDLPFAHSKLDEFFQRWEGWVVSRLGIQPTRRYWQHHAFPNLLCSFTDAVTLVHSILPCSPDKARSFVLQFSPTAPSFGWRKLLSSIWGRLEAMCTKRILLEDVLMYGRIQSGLNASYHSGRLARSEERIHRFQEYWIDTMASKKGEV
jgi:choline monooxygenase